jgi:predicted Zn-dependent protease with MMP-like domain
MDSQKFEQLVIRAVESLPDEFRERLDNIDVIIADQPSPEQMKSTDRKRGGMLLGLYEGIPLTHRHSSYGMVTPDRITIFQKPIEAVCRNNTEIVEEIRRVVLHEIAHHFGIGDDRLKELGM